MRGQIPSSTRNPGERTATRTPSPAPGSAAGAGGAGGLAIAPLSIVSYAYSEFKGDRRVIETLRTALLSQYENIGAKGQGTWYPLFTEEYLSQDMRSKVPAELINWIRACCQAFLERQAPSVEVIVTLETLFPLWGNLHKAGEYHVSHNHGVGQFVLSGVFFVSAPSDLKSDSEGLLVLERSSLPGIETRFDLVYRPGDKIHIRPVPGWLVLFPPFVQHYVTPHSSAEPRMSIAFNVGNAAIIGPKSKDSTDPFKGR